MARAEELSAGIRSHVEDAERSLTNLVVNTSETIQTGARAAQQSLLTVSSDVGAQLKLTSSEVERALTAVGTDAANSILTSARDAQTTLVTASDRCREPDQVAVRRRRADALGRRHRDRRRRSSPARARPRPRWSRPPRMRPTRSSRSPPTSNALARRHAPAHRQRARSQITWRACTPRPKTTLGRRHLGRMHANPGQVRCARRAS